MAPENPKTFTGGFTGLTGSLQSKRATARLRINSVKCKKKNINDVALGIINGRVQSTAQVHANVNTNLQVRDQLGG